MWSRWQVQDFWGMFAPSSDFASVLDIEFCCIFSLLHSILLPRMCDWHPCNPSGQIPERSFPVPGQDDLTPRSICHRWARPHWLNPILICPLKPRVFASEWLLFDPFCLFVLQTYYLFISMCQVLRRGWICSDWDAFSWFWFPCNAIQTKTEAATGKPGWAD